MQHRLSKKPNSCKFKVSIHKTSLALFTAATITMSSVLATPADAMETHMIVEFQRKIHDKIETLQHTNTTLKTSTEQLSEEKKQIATDFARTTNRDDQRILLKRNLAVRSKSALNAASGIVNMQQTIEEMVGDLEQLERMQENVGVNGASASSEEDRIIAGEIIRGMTGMYDTVAAFTPTSEKMVGIREKLAFNDASFRAHFDKNSPISVHKQIEFLEDQHSTLAAALKLIKSERDNLRNASNMILQGEIKDIVNKIDTNSIVPIYVQIMNGRNEMFEMINTVNNSPRAPKRSSVVYDLSRAGVGYKHRTITP